MISSINYTPKIRYRSMDTDVYVDELPLNWRDYDVDERFRCVDRKSYRVANRQHLVNTLPEK